jgi:galactokinase
MTRDKASAVALEAHHEWFGVEGQAFGAPGRVNLIGEHTDYTGGLVMPMAIEAKSFAVISAREDGRAVFHAADFEQDASYEIDLPEWTARGDWSDYPAGVAWGLRQLGVALGGFSLSLSSDVPLGAGLSSSASIEVATALALLAHVGVDLSLMEIATLCRRAENEYVGAQTGIMDQFVVTGGVAHRAMLLDCRSLEFELLPLPDEIRVVIANSMVKHQLATDEYGDRRGEVEAGQAVLRQEMPHIELLRDATVEDLEQCAGMMTAESLARCRHIITENVRVVEARAALLASDMQRFGELMVRAHISMRDDFAASCAEVDLLVELAMRQPECFGARITGGGFGGCTVNIVRAGSVDGFVKTLRREYFEATGIVPDCFVSSASDGALALLEIQG